MKEWPQKINSRKELNSFLNEKLREAEQTNENFKSETWYHSSGNIKNLSKTGWFHTEKQDGKWWLVDPDGRAFFSSGIDCIHPGTDTRVDVMMPYLVETLNMMGVSKDQKKFDFMLNNLKEAFGEEDWWISWAKIIKSYLYKWGINTIGNWSSVEFIQWAKMPYVIPLDAFVKDGFPKTENCIFRDFPDVFATEYEDRANNYAKALEPFKDDPNMIGYFMRNEPEWGFVYNLNIAEEMLATPFLSASKRVFIEHMQEKYQNIESFNDAWGLNLRDFCELGIPLPNASILSISAHKDLYDLQE
ncbi:hypothetical protein [Mesobacillus foraminis]|uniref:hypothetical protein n=1 Tax=Mesobacillus foraminis TaxID=279826 RepID=UPI000EF4F454|nr:hypothetical protein [Mesobacillus foraminis]